MIKFKGDTDMNNLTDKLENINACNEAVEWIKSFSSYEEAWDKCDRGDWMLWIAQRAGTDLRTLIKAGVECTKLVEHLMVDERSINALRIAEMFADGMATRAELRQAADATHDAAYVTVATNSTVYFTDAADAATYAAYAVHAADSDAAYAAAHATDSADDASAYKETLNKCANICRQYIDFSKIGAFLESIND